MVSKIGSFGNVFGNNGDNNKVNKSNDAQKPKEIIDVTQHSKVEHKELGDDVLTSANFYAGMGLDLKTKKTQPGSLEDLTQVVQNLNASKADRADKKAAFNAVQGNDWSSYLTKAYVYSRMNDTSMKTLASVDFSIGNMPEYIADDLNAEVVIA